MRDQTESVSKKLVQYLKLEGVTHVFGIPGGAIAPLLLEFYDNPGEIEYVITRQETGAAYMADGYFRATGRLGVVAVTSGPGATNALTGALNAQTSCSRVLILTGEVKEEFYGKGYLQEGSDGPLDVNNVFNNAVGYSAVLSNPGNAKTLIEAALRVAGSIPHQSTHISMPVDIASGHSASKVPAAASDYTPRVAGPAEANVAETLEILAKAKRPLILLGNGCRGPLRNPETLAKIQAFAQDWGIPVMTTADGKSVYPEEDEMSVGAFGLANCMWPYHWFTQTEPAYDALLVVASGLGQLATNVWNPMMVPDGPIIQVDANPDIIARVFETKLGIEGDAGLLFDGMAALQAKHRPDAALIAERKAKLAEIKSTHSPFEDPEAYASQAAPIHPAAVCRIMQETLPPKNTMVFLDAGNCVGWGVHYLMSGPGFEVHSSLDMGPMGFAVGAVIGAKIARPEVACVALTGDAAFMMQGAEVSTAARNGVGAIWVVLDDADLAMGSQGMTHFFGRDHKRWSELYALGAPNLQTFSEGLGAEAYTVHSPAEMQAAMVQAQAGAAKGRPQVVVAKINRAAQPPYYTPIYAANQDAGGL